MRLSRLDFLKGALSALGLGALGDGRVFAAPPGWKPPTNANLTFGAVSDTHLRTAHNGNGPGANWPDKYFVAALTYFREQNVDAVMHCGDLAHRGQVRELEFHARAWNKVFPKNRAPDGHEVVKLFVNGNHDVDGAGYGDFVAKRYPDPSERAKHVLATDMAAHWQRIWGEPYEEVWHKEVKGYHFFGRHYGPSETKIMGLVKEYAKKAGIAKGPKPFFLCSHIRPHSKLNKALRPYRNAVYFFGHWHRSAANWNNIYFWGAQPAVQVPSCEPRGSGALGSDAYIAKAQIERVEAVGKCRQGYVVRVYDDMLVISRREFGEGGSLGPDWIMPLGAYEPHPFSKDELKKKIGEPQFKEGAKLGVGIAPERADAHERVHPAIALSIPLADGNPESRVYAYDVAGAGAEGEPKLYKSVYAAGCNMGVGHEQAVTTLNVPLKQLPKGDVLTFAARPLSSLGTTGRPISATWRRIDG
ncbi:MAG: metallophosphoesterase [Kiritimatiellae bacterium]|nr:metallophosphoesterase [Kiritimatiellia bacterium]